jgi:hypothetical protein
MLILKTESPYIGDVKIPLHYSLLYPQLIRIWKELISYLDTEGVSYRVNRHNLELHISVNRASKILARIHMSFMIVNGYYEGDFKERSFYTKKLWRVYIPGIINGLENMVVAIGNKNYDEAYNEASMLITLISQAEVDHAITGGIINQTIFYMLHGQIPQTYTNTYLLAAYGSEQVKHVVSKVYESIVNDAVKTIRILKTNRRMVENLRRR